MGQKPNFSPSTKSSKISLGRLRRPWSGTSGPKPGREGGGGSRCKGSGPGAPPRVHSTTSLQWYRGASCAPPFISSEPPLRTEPLPDPPHGVMGYPDRAPDRVGASKPPLDFVDGNGYIVLRGLVEARDCQVWWNKVMKAWGTAMGIKSEV